MDIKVLASGSGGNCYRISDGHTSLLLDAGIPIKQIRIGCNFRMSEIAGCLVTHYHGDHSKAVKDLLRVGVNIHIPKLEADALGLKPHHRLHYLQSGEKTPYQVISIGTFLILPFQAEHDTPEPVGYLVESYQTREKLLYFTDTYFLKYTFSNLTHIIGECNYTNDELHIKLDEGSTPLQRVKRLYTSHMSLDNFLEMLKANKSDRLRQIYICHMSDDHGDEEKIKTEVQRLTGAEVYIC